MVTLIFLFQKHLCRARILNSFNFAQKKKQPSRLHFLYSEIITVHGISIRYRSSH